jgi:hypothetical protein
MNALILEIIDWLEMGMDIDDHAFVIEADGKSVTLDLDGEIATFTIILTNGRYSAFN